jgi:hypothetical protein
MKAITVADIVLGFSTGDIDGHNVPASLQHLPPGRLRVVSGGLVDAAGLATFYVDEQGLKHVTAGAGRQPVSCSWDTVLTRSDGLWRVPTVSERISPSVKAECARRILAVASTNTQMNMTAAQAAGRFSASDQAAYGASLDWVDAMRARCAALIAAGDMDFASDDKWVAAPSGVAALAARY